MFGLWNKKKSPNTVEELLLLLDSNPDSIDFKDPNVIRLLLQDYNKLRKKVKKALS